MNKDGIMTFSDYWRDKKTIFEKLGVDQDVAHMIWVDAIRTLENEIYKHVVKR